MAIEILDSSKTLIVKAKNYFERGLVLDMYSYAAANMLACTQVFAPAIEIRGGRVILRALENAYVSITGWGEALLNRVKAPLWKTLKLRKGDVLEIRAPPHSVSYVTVLGGLKVDGNGFNRWIEPGLELTCLEYIDEDYIDKIHAALYVPEKYIPTCTSDGLAIKVAPFIAERGVSQAVLISKVLEKEYILRQDKISTLNGHEVVEEHRASPGTLALKNEKMFSIPLVNLKYKLPLIGEIAPASLDTLARIPQNRRIKIIFTGRNLLKDDILSYMRRIRKLRKLLEAAKQAAERGAKLFKLKVNGILYDIWIEEL